MILASAIVNVFIDLPMTGIVLLVATVATLSMLNFNTPAGLSRHSMQEANAAQDL